MISPNDLVKCVNRSRYAPAVEEGKVWAAQPPKLFPPRRPPYTPNHLVIPKRSEGSHFSLMTAPFVTAASRSLLNVNRLFWSLTPVIASAFDCRKSFSNQALQRSEGSHFSLMAAPHVTAANRSILNVNRLFWPLTHEVVSAFEHQTIIF